MPVPRGSVSRPPYSPPPPAQAVMRDRLWAPALPPSPSPTRWSTSPPPGPSLSTHQPGGGSTDPRSPRARELHSLLSLATGAKGGSRPVSPCELQPPGALLPRPCPASCMGGSGTLEPAGHAFPGSHPREMFSSPLASHLTQGATWWEGGDPNSHQFTLDPFPGTFATS